MLKIFIFIIYSTATLTSHASEKIKIGSVEIKIPREYEISKEIKDNLICHKNPQKEEFYIALRTCSKSFKQQNQKGQMDELQAGIEQPLAVLP